MGCKCECCGAELPLANLWLCDACITQEEKDREILEAIREKQSNVLYNDPISGFIYE